MSKDRTAWLPVLWCGFAAALLSACAVGPDFQRPQPPSGRAWPTGVTPQPGSASAPAATQSTMPGAASVATAAEAAGESSDSVLPARWWTLFGSEELNTLVDESLARHPGIDAARDALRAAHELRLAQQGAYWPTVQADLGSTRQKVAPALASPVASNASIYNLSTSQVSVGFVPDVFGGNRRAVESLAAQEEGQAFQLEATRQALAANLVSAAITEAALRAQIDATQAAIQTARDQLELSRRQLQLGAIAEAGVISQEAALAQTETALPLLRKQLAQQRDLIAQLSGRLPGDAPAVTFDFAKLRLPANVPVAAPSTLVQRRPDVRMAESQWHAATAQVGAARAARFPSFQLTGTLGGAAGGLAAMLQASNAFWQLGASVAQSVFQGGTLLHRERAAQAQADQAGAQYRSTVLNAFQNVADALQALDADRETLQVAQRAEQAAQRSLDVSMRQLRFGDISYLGTLDARRTWQQAVTTRLQAQASSLADVSALCYALGGGWSGPS